MKQLTAKHYTSETVLYNYFSQMNHTLEDLKNVWDFLNGCKKIIDLVCG